VLASAASASQEFSSSLGFESGGLFFFLSLGSSLDQASPVTESVDRLSSEIHCLRQVLDEVREDVSWLARNGLPVQPIDHVHVRRMARDVNADDWNEPLVIERIQLHTPGQLAAIATPELLRLTEELQSAVESLMVGQIGPILKAVDEVQTALIDAMQRSQTKPSVNGDEMSVSVSVSVDAGTSTPLCPPEHPQQPRIEPGRLF